MKAVILAEETHLWLKSICRGGRQADEVAGRQIISSCWLVRRVASRYPETASIACDRRSAAGSQDAERAPQTRRRNWSSLCRLPVQERFLPQGAPQVGRINAASTLVSATAVNGSRAQWRRPTLGMGSASPTPAAWRLRRSTTLWSVMVARAPGQPPTITKTNPQQPA